MTQGSEVRWTGEQWMIIMRNQIALAVAKEREACAALADDAAEDCLLHREQAQAEIAWQIAGTIRSRK